MFTVFLIGVIIGVKMHGKYNYGKSEAERQWWRWRTYQWKSVKIIKMAELLRVYL